MAKIQPPKPLRFEDFKAEEKELITKISESYNQFNEDVYRQLNGNIDFDNLNRQLAMNVIVRTNSAGQVVNNPQIRIKTKTTPKGLSVVFAENQVNSNIYPVSHPFISYTIKNNLITILNVSGLQANSEYKLNIEVVA